MILNNRNAELSFKLSYVLEYIDEFRVPVDVKSSNFLPGCPPMCLVGKFTCLAKKTTLLSRFLVSA